MPQSQIITYPIPLYSNVPPVPTDYKPRRFVIANVTLGVQTVVETETTQDYVVGQLIRLIIPPEFGCVQLNGKQGYVISIIDDTQIVTDIDSSVNVNLFVPAIADNEPAILAIGDTNTGVQNVDGRNNLGLTVPGAFQNIS